MLQNISSLKYFHGSNGELKQMGFQHDLSTYQTLLTQIIVQQSCSWIHITFWEKQQGYSENGYATQRQFRWLAQSHGMGTACQSYCPCRCLYAKVGAQCLGRASVICHKMLEKEFRNGRNNGWEISLGNQGEGQKSVRREKRSNWRPSFPKFRLHARKLELKTFWWCSKEARFYHRGGCISAVGEDIATARRQGLASPNNVPTQAPSQWAGLVCLSWASWELEGDHKPPSTVASYWNWWGSCQCAIILDITVLKIVLVFFLASLLFSGALKI